MVGTIYLLPRGGFGNLLFNYLIGYSLSKKYAMKLAFVDNYNSAKRKHMKRYQLFKDCTYITMDRIPISKQIIKESSFQYSPVSIKNPDKCYLLNGYYQSYKYSLEYIKNVKEIIK